jgi:hypothetical protein
MLDHKMFYNKFQINYFDYKLAYLVFAEEHFRDWHQEDKILNYSEKDFILAVKSDIRQTLFQAIETLFEIIFALFPQKNAKLPDMEILRTLSKGAFPYDKINKIAEDQIELDFLKKEIILSNKEKVTLGEYIFYYNIAATGDYIDKIRVSLEAIRKGLHILAIEFSDRKEYNCYKHGLRLVPAVNFFEIKRVDTQETIKKFDLTDSLTYYSEDTKIGKTEYVTKVFETERDKRLITLCSGLLWNIIKIRDVIFNKLPKHQNGALSILFFDDDIISKATRISINLNDLRLSFTKSND